MSAIMDNPKLWSYRRIPYIFESGYPYKSEVRSAMNKWESAVGVSFVERVNEPNYILVKKADGTSNSAIGMQGGEQTVIINNGYIGLHELGHTLGLIHEQSRSDRDIYINMEWNHIQGGVNAPDFRKDGSSNNLTPYDLKSVMHYPAPAIGWRGIPEGEEVWTMRWKADNSKKLGAGAYQGWGDLSDEDKSKTGLSAAYSGVIVPMGSETDNGSWNNPYATQFPFTVGGKQYFYGQNEKNCYWFIQELLTDGKMGAETDNGTWKYFYEAQFSFEVGGRTFFYGQNTGGKNWFIQELLPDGKMGAQTDNGTWKFAYAIQFPFTVGGRVFFYGQNLNEKNWFIQELLPDGKMGVETDHGNWNNAYGAQFPYNINGNQYFYGQNLDSEYWFIQQLNSDGTMGHELQGGFWKYPYAVQFPFAIGGKQYFYGQKIPSGYNWFIQELINV